MSVRKTLIVNYDPNEIYFAGEYLLTLFSKMTGRKLAVIEVSEEELGDYEGTVLHEAFIEQNVIFKIPKPVKPKIDDLYESLCDMIGESYIIGGQQSTFAFALRTHLQVFSGSVIDAKSTFPTLMDRFITDHNYHNSITKIRLRDGMSYKGIHLKPRTSGTDNLNTLIKIKIPKAIITDEIDHIQS